MLLKIALTVSALCVALIGQATAAPEETARTETERIALAQALAGEGRTLYREGDHAGALQRFKGAHALYPDPTYDCYAGLTYVQLKAPHRGQYFMARCKQRARRQAALPGWLVDELALVEQALARDAGYAPITLQVASPGVQARLTPAFADDEAIAPPVTVWAPRGEHTLRAIFTQGPPLTRTLTVADASPQTVKLAPPAVKPPPAVKIAPAQPAPEPQRPEIPLASAPPELQASADNGVAWALSGVGGAMILTGSVLGTLSLIGWLDLEDDKNDISDGRLRRRQEIIDTQATAAWALAGVGAVALYFGLTSFSEGEGPTVSWSPEGVHFGWRARWP